MLASLHKGWFDLELDPASPMSAYWRILLQNSDGDHLGATKESKLLRSRIILSERDECVNQSCVQMVRNSFCNRIGRKADVMADPTEGPVKPKADLQV